MSGAGGPPRGWDPDEAAERVRARAHARPEHKQWLTEKDKNDKRRTCGDCQGGRIDDR